MRMKFLISQSLILSLLFLKIGFAQNKTIVSDLENLTLNIGQLFKPVSNVVLSDGTTGDCKRIIYYKILVFNKSTV